jgi:hypothetical protein
MAGMGGVQVDALARAIAERLNPVLPAQTHIEAEGSEIEFFGFDGSYGRTELDAGWFSDIGGNEWTALEHLAEYILSDVQDSVADATRGQAWPPSPHYPRVPLPEPWAEVRTGELHFGYTDSAIAFAPIPLGQIAGTGPKAT